jgi:hypothetical protein
MPLLNRAWTFYGVVILQSCLQGLAPMRLKIPKPSQACPNLSKAVQGPREGGGALIGGASAVTRVVLVWQSGYWWRALASRRRAD